MNKKIAMSYCSQFRDKKEEETGQSSPDTQSLYMDHNPEKMFGVISHSSREKNPLPATDPILLYGGNSKKQVEVISQFTEDAGQSLFGVISLPTTTETGHSSPDTQSLYMDYNPEKMFQDNPESFDPKLHRRNKCKGWKTTGGAIAEAKRQYELRVVNEELLGHPYTQEMTIALKVEVDEKTARAIADTISYAIRYATRHDPQKPEYCRDLHINRDNHLDWHHTFETYHDFEKVKKQLRKTITKKHNLRGRQFEIETKPYTDDGWLLYVGRVKKDGWHKDRYGDSHKTDDFYYKDRVLFSKDCKLRRTTYTSNLWVKPIAELQKIIEQRKNTTFIEHNPQVVEHIDHNAKFAYGMMVDDYTKTDEELARIRLEDIREDIITATRKDWGRKYHKGLSNEENLFLFLNPSIDLEIEEETKELKGRGKVQAVRKMIADLDKPAPIALETGGECRLADTTPGVMAV